MYLHDPKYWALLYNTTDSVRKIMSVTEYTHNYVMCKLWIWTIHGLCCSKHRSMLDLHFARTIHKLDKPCSACGLCNCSMHLHHICGRPRLTRLHCDLLTHMHWHYQRRTHRNQARTLPVSFVQFDYIIKWKCVWLTSHT